MKNAKRNVAWGFFMAFLFTLVLMTTPVLAANTSSDAVINSVNIMLDGEVVGNAGSNYTLSNGSSVPLSIVYEGTTYLPVRKLSELLGKDVGYISATNTVVLGTMPERSRPGWYLIDKEFVPYQYDFQIYGECVSSTSSGEKLYDKYTGVGEEGSYIISHSRRSGSNANPSYFSDSLVEFSGAPTYMAEGKTYSMDLAHQVMQGDWGYSNVCIEFSSVEEIGYGASDDITFVDVNGKGYYEKQTGTVTTEDEIPAGDIDSIRYIKVSLGNGYGYRYTYEWRN